MIVAEIEALHKVKQATEVLVGLKRRGLVEPAIASGWTRAMLTDTTTRDIDVSYVGPVHYEKAQQHLREVLAELGADPKPWDIKGIWNAQMAYGVTHTVENYLIYYVNSIDSIYLTTDGKLHDPTGYGFLDAEARMLRINDYDNLHGIKQVPQEEVNICLESCRRVAQLGWSVTPESKQRIKQGVRVWSILTDTEKAYFFRKLASKFKSQEREDAQKSFDQFGWGFVFDHLS